MADAKQGKTPVEDFCNGSSQSRVVLAKPRLGGFGSSGFGSSSSKSNNPFGSILRPPQLKPGNNNPFLKITDADESQANKDNNKPEDRIKDAKDDDKVPKFVPLGSSNVTHRNSNQVPIPPQPTASASSSSFVFGQSLSERVVIKENVNNGEASTVNHTSSNGTTELLFTSAAASVKENSQVMTSTNTVSGSQGLAAAAAEYERSHARPPPPTSNCTITGEEGEINVLQISCRLFAWEAGSWRERGRGVLRLNDAASGEGSRVVARVSGSLRVVLNTKLWPDMVVEQAGPKSLRITAADALQQIKLFLIMGTPGDITQLSKAITSRVVASKKKTSNICTQITSHKSERLEMPGVDDECLDKRDDGIPEDDEVDEPESVVDEDSQENDPDINQRLVAESEQKETDTTQADMDCIKEEKDTKALKRKEPVEDEMSPKRPCPEILIE